MCSKFSCFFASNPRFSRSSIDLNWVILYLISCLMYFFNTIMSLYSEFSSVIIGLPQNFYTHATSTVIYRPDCASFLLIHHD